MTTSKVPRTFRAGLHFPEVQRALDAAAAPFPETFGLRAFPRDTFRISEGASYLGGPANRTPMLYTERLGKDGVWREFAKGTVQQLRDEMVKVDPEAPLLLNDDMLPHDSRGD